jgi:hypothetical protein
MKLQARPAEFSRCFVSEANRDCHVEPIEGEKAVEAHCFAFELQDIINALKEGRQEDGIAEGQTWDPGYSLDSRPDLGLVRYILHPKGARDFASQLIYELGRSGDELGQRLCSVLAEAMVNGEAKEGWWFPLSADEK